MTSAQADTTKAAEHYTALAAQIKAERADMLLRAAAPDLLEALEALVATDTEGETPQWRNARAAIAKAKGQ